MDVRFTKTKVIEKSSKKSKTILKEKGDFNYERNAQRGC